MATLAELTEIAELLGINENEELITWAEHDIVHLGSETQYLEDSMESKRLSYLGAYFTDGHWSIFV